MKRKVVWSVLTCLMALFLVISCSSSPTVGEKPSGTSQQATTTAEKLTEVLLQIGETGRTSNVEVTVSNAVVSENYTAYSRTGDFYYTNQAEAGDKYILFDAKIKNLSSKILLEQGRDTFSVIDSKSNIYTPFWSYIGKKIPMASHVTLEAGNEVQGDILIVIKRDSADLKIQYVIEPGPPAKYMIWEVK